MPMSPRSWLPPCCLALAGALLFALPAPLQGDDQFEDWLRAKNAEYSRFVSDQDRQFARFLDDNWVRKAPESLPVSAEPPKPVEPPRVTEPPSPPEPPGGQAPPSEVISRQEFERRLDEATRRRPAKPPAPPEPDASRPTVDVPVSFLGHDLEFVVPRELSQIQRIGSPKESLGDVWLDLSAAGHEALSRQIGDHIASLQLGDWGRFRLLEELSQALYPRDEVRARVVHWYLLLRAGQDVRLAHDDRGVYLMFSAEEEVYELVFVGMSDRKYYLWGFDVAQREGSIETYDCDFPGTAIPLRLTELRLPHTVPDRLTRHLAVPRGEAADSISVALDRHLLEYLDSVPQAQLSMHFAPGPSADALASLAAGLTPLLADQDERTAVQNLLSFVQHSFGYRTDQDQFGRERSLFCDQTLYYPDSDCEDRAILFAALVRTLLGLEVVGLDYPGHVATAVRFSTPVPGDAFELDGARYVVCDPTYIGAGIGRTQERYRGQSPGVIRVAQMESSTSAPR